MTDALFFEIDNTPRDYPWGVIDGVAHVRGYAETGAREAELWLGAHRSAPSRFVDQAPWPALDAWEDATGARLPFLLKILCASEPLSLQAHPSTAQAQEGFARENAAGIPLDAADRNYRDPNAKPELIVALHDGFEALCGFRAASDVDADLAALATQVEPERGATIAHWRELLAGEDGIRRAFFWLLSGDEALPALVEAATAVAARDGRFALLTDIAAAHPADPGILGALMLQHLTLRAGESLWLPAGNIHAYLKGSGIELMGPSDNVLRGGLTGKHIDTTELDRVLDASEGADPHLVPTRVGDGVQLFQPVGDDPQDQPGFGLYEVTGDGAITTGGPAIALTVDGRFSLAADGQEIDVPRGRAVLLTRGAEVTVTGSGRLFLAAGA